jgi:hypothetical protein
MRFDPVSLGRPARAGTESGAWIEAETCGAGEAGIDPADRGDAHDPGQRRIRMIATATGRRDMKAV